MICRLPALFFLVLCGLVACNGIEMTGTFDDYDAFTEEAIPIVMPPNANFQSQQFHRAKERGKAAHNGLDIWGRLRTPILAAAPGRVTRSYYEPNYGHRVVIDHGTDTNGDRVETVYKHLKERQVAEGDTVTRAQQIGTMGATGALGMMVHLHFEVWRRKPGSRHAVAYDPQLFWVQGPGRVTCFDKTARYPEAPFRTTYPVICK